MIYLDLFQAFLCQVSDCNNFRICSPYHMVTVELLHDRGLIQKLNALPHAGRLINGLNSHSRLRFILDHSLGDALVHHAEGALAQLLVHGDFLPGHFPLIRDVHWHKTTDSRSTPNTHTTVYQWRIEKIFDILTVSSTEVLWVHRCIQDSIPQPITVSGDKKHNAVSQQQAALTVDGICNSL